MVMKPDKRLQHRKSIAEVNERRERLIDWLSAGPRTGAEIELRSKEIGLANSRKTIERDLAFLSRENLAVREEGVKPGAWSLTDAARKTKFKRVADAIGLLLLQRYFRHVFDREQLKDLDSAAEALKYRLPSSEDGRWLDRLRILPPGLNMSTVPPGEGVKEELIKAVKRARKVHIVHIRPGKPKFEGAVSVWGLVSRADKLAVIVKPDNSDYPLRLVASWIAKAVLLQDAPEESPPAGVLDKYLAKEEDFDKGRVIKVVLRANENDARYWEKNRPGQDTEIEQDGAAYRVSFKAANLDTLVMFLLSLGSRVEVLEPESVRTKVRDELRLASEQYLATSGNG